jgi:flavin-dependent dehydrogenase
MAAIELASHGIGVLVVDRSVFPREKVCGDGLLEESLEILAGVGIDAVVRERAHPIGCIRFVAPNGSEFRMQGDFCTLRRSKLDALLLAEACGRGADFRGGITMTGPLLRGAACAGATGYERTGRRLSITATLVLLASGANSALLHAFGVLERRPASAVGVRGYFRLRDGADERTMVISYDRHLLPGYGWIFPMGDGVFNVGRGVSLDRRGRMPHLRHELRALQEHAQPLSTLVRRAEPLGSLRTATMRTGFRGSRACTSGLLVLGEALGLTFPFLGEGIGSALASGRVAARVARDALDRGDCSAHFLQRYERALRQQLDVRHKAYLSAQSWFRYAPVVSFFIARAAHDHGLKALVREILIGKKDARAVFSLHGLGRLFLSRCSAA